jgi:hypothetical protein
MPGGDAVKHYRVTVEKRRRLWIARHFDGKVTIASQSYIGPEVAVDLVGQKLAAGLPLGVTSDGDAYVVSVPARCELGKEVQG